MVKITNYEKLCKEQRREITLQRVKLSQQESTIERQAFTILQLEKRLTELERRDNYHDGPNTPPSKNSITRQQDRKMRAENKKPSERKQGGQPGHKGASRKISIDEKKDHTLERCTRCGS